MIYNLFDKPTAYDSGSLDGTPNFLFNVLSYARGNVAHWGFRLLLFFMVSYTGWNFRCEDRVCHALVFMHLRHFLLASPVADSSRLIREINTWII